MPMSIPEYAKLRGVTTTGVYKALERHPEIEEHTHKGTVNGKAAKILEDEAVGLLDQVMRMPKQDNSLITACTTLRRGHTTKLQRQGKRLFSRSVEPLRMH